MSLASNAAQPTLATPCILVCTMGRSGYCLGCGRTLEEIGAWTSLSPSARLAIMEELAARKAGFASDSTL